MAEQPPPQTTVPIGDPRIAAEGRCPECSCCMLVVRSARYIGDLSSNWLACAGGCGPGVPHG